MIPSGRLWPSGFVGWVTIVLLAAIAAQWAGAAILIGLSERQLERTDIARRIAEQLVVAGRILEDGGAETIPNLSTEHLTFSLTDEPIDLSDGTSPRTGAVLSEILRWEPSLAAEELIITAARFSAPGAQGRIEGTLRVDENTWVRFETDEPLGGFASIMTTIVWVATVALLVMVVAVWLVRTLGAPLRALASSADLVGTGVRIPFEEERGPPDLRRLAGTLNRMQTRIDNLLTSQTRALAAVSHDLRTPLARMRLRLEAPSLDDERPGMRADLAEMDAMLSSLLAFLNDAAAQEKMERINLASLVETVVAEAADAGRPAVYEGPARVDAVVRPFLLKRAIANLVDNAVKYGGGAHVTLDVHDEKATLSVDDEGEGVDEAVLPHLTEPFFRGDHARARTTEGFGLGLSNAAQIAAAHDGTLTLSNRPGGGFRAVVTLPLEVRHTSSRG
ncbi:ATP-binding protein [Parvularcula dongshanensis]|uniref:histidine kinase n=1 Tax=Parvularcula dongshanensis TaxID=1173995 RepID=A0A840I4Z9_9PROT|nr:ATP-binding protein [Parvularcula dongshanensis]MBB4659100.1 signal transduction histidine kinase [Parvularcula dongshanensis]